MHNNEFSGILDVVDNRAQVRADGYLPGPDDLTVPARTVREHGLRRGDLITGNGTTIETVNGLPPRKRPAFADLTPLYPNERLRLETEPHALTARVLDLVMPVGKGQRALIVAPPKAGKTSVLQAIAHGISKNHPECHLMFVLVGERPEEVTDLSRSAPGEVVAATFDRHPREHIALAHLLLHLVDLYGVKDDDGILIGAAFTHADIAHMVGATRQWVTISLKRMHDKDIVLSRKSRIIVRRPDLLEKMRGDGSKFE
jgi:transcription termination factor Rho